MSDTASILRHYAECSVALSEEYDTIAMQRGYIRKVADELEQLQIERATLDVMAEVGFNQTMDGGEEIRRLRAALREIADNPETGASAAKFARAALAWKSSGK